MRAGLAVVLGGWLGLVATPLRGHDFSGIADAASAPTMVLRTQEFDPIRIQWLHTHFDVWLRRGNGEIDLATNSDGLALLQKQGFVVQEQYGMSQSLRKLGKSLPMQVNGIAGYPCYRTVEESYASMDALAAQYPGLVRVQNFGQSYLQSVGSGGYPLRALILENSNNSNVKAPLLLIAAIHAREYTTAETALRFAEQLLRRYQSDADAKWILDHQKLVIVPLMNPDGRKRAETGLSWRKNLRPGCGTANSVGVDLNRNSTYLWGTNNASSTLSCEDTYRGTAAASEPEVQALESLMASVFVDQRGPNFTDAAPNNASGMFISLHSYANLVLFPWGAQATNAPNKNGLQSVARKMGFFTQYKVCQPPAAGCLYAASGTSDDQSYGEYGVASMTFELGNNGFFESCAIFENQTLGKMLPALDFAAKTARAPYIESQGPELVQLRAQAISDTEIRIQGTADDTRYFTGSTATEATQNIAEVRLYAAPPWLGGSFIALNANDVFNSSVESFNGVLNAPSARSTVYLVALDGANNHGPVSAISLPAAGEVLLDGFE